MINARNIDEAKDMIFEPKNDASHIINNICCCVYEYIDKRLVYGVCVRFIILTCINRWLQPAYQSPKRLNICWWWCYCWIISFVRRFGRTDTQKPKTIYSTPIEYECLCLEKTVCTVRCVMRVCILFGLQAEPYGWHTCNDAVPFDVQPVLPNPFDVCLLTKMINYFIGKMSNYEGFYLPYVWSIFASSYTTFYDIHMKFMRAFQCLLITHPGVCRGKAKK